MVIPAWPDGRLEAIHAVYNRKTILPVLEDLWQTKTLELWQVTKHAHKTLFLATEELAEVDPKLLSFLDADTPSEFKTLESIESSRSRA